MNIRTKKILIFAEAVSLAHLLRPMAIAQDLKNRGYQVFLAVTHIPKNLEYLAEGLNIIRLLDLIPSQVFLASIAKGEHPFSEDILEAQVFEDLETIGRVKPDIVLGDMRLSLHVSCQLTKSTYVNLSNSQWDPNTIQARVIPELPIVKIIGVKLAMLVMEVIKPLLFWQLALPFNKIAKKFGVKSYGNYMEVLSSGDYTFYLDFDGFSSQNTKFATANETFPQKTKLEVGALDYSIHSSDKGKVPNITNGKKKIFISLGSSGPARLLDVIVDKLKEMDFEIYIATSGLPCNIKSSNQIQIFDYIAFDKIIPHCDLVICNGGSASVYPILRHGIPILAIPMNFDQHLFVNSILKFNVGLSIRSDSLSEKSLFQSVTQLLEDKNFKINSEELSQKLKSEYPMEIISSHLKTILTSNQYAQLAGDF